MKKHLSFFLAIIIVFSLIVQISPVAFSSEPSDSGFKSVYQSMKSKYSDISLTASGDDISCFWDMITKKALGLNSKVDVDFYSLDYDEMSSQILGKVLITMVNNNFDVNTPVYNSSNSVINLLNTYLVDGEFSKSGASNVTMATEQVWVMMGYVLSNSHLDEDCWDYLLSQQNADGGFGYGAWSDITTSLWVKTLIELAEKEDELHGCVLLIDDYVKNNIDSAKAMYDTNSLASIVSYSAFDGSNADDILRYIIDHCYHTDGYFTWGGYDGENDFATQAGAQMIGEYFNGSVYSKLLASYSPNSDESDDEEDSKIVYVTNNTTNSTDNSSKETNNRSTKNQTINNYYQQSDPVVVTNTVTKEIVKDIEIPSNEITVNSHPVSNVQPAITLNIPNYRTEIRIFLGAFALIAVSYSIGTFFKVLGGNKNDK